jgi:hypothetical protein
MVGKTQSLLAEAFVVWVQENHHRRLYRPNERRSMTVLHSSNFSDVEVPNKYA